jgi:hypothetical protein
MQNKISHYSTQKHIFKFFVNTESRNTEIPQVYTKILNKKRNTFLKLKKHPKF